MNNEQKRERGRTSKSSEIEIGGLKCQRNGGNGINAETRHFLGFDVAVETVQFSNGKEGEVVDEETIDLLPSPIHVLHSTMQWYGEDEEKNGREAGFVTQKEGNDDEKVNSEKEILKGQRPAIK